MAPEHGGEQMAFTAQALEEAQDGWRRAKEKLSRFREKAEVGIGQAIQATEVSGTAFALGYANGKWGEDGELTVAGVPVDLGVGIALTGVAMFGGLGKYAEHGVNVGSGALAAAAYRTGFQLGQESASSDDTGDSQQQKSSSARKTVAQAAARRTINGAGQQVSVGSDGRTVTVHERAA